MEGLLGAVCDPLDDAVPRFIRMLRRGDSNDERLHRTSMAPPLWVIFKWRWFVKSQGQRVGGVIDVEAKLLGSRSSSRIRSA